MMFGGNMMYFQRMLLKKTYISIISFMKITSLLCVKNKSKNLELIKFDLIAKTIFLRFRKHKEEINNINKTNRLLYNPFKTI
jgi:hypothetical protein